MGYTTGLSNMTGYFTNECFFSKNFKCIEDAKIVDKSVKIELRNDIDSQIEIHDVELDCGKSKLTKIYPGNLVNPKERFVLNILCENDIYETMKINYTDKSTGENILFEGKV